MKPVPKIYREKQQHTGGPMPWDKAFDEMDYGESGERLRPMICSNCGKPVRIKR